ncbi:MAG TPA: SRPBCC family protein [Actinophytocola sp.]|uniref:SRPBCC family protein n=1 Tax=Actinophytocola sp. TaxID=1872138 RepID=UPI002DDD4681|nr:SRPBCC family protein [Actinophytocola sp.]HEV2783131.1 SRPBCC family protein [Actinophytocola sp.]
MRRYQIDVTERTSADPATVYALLRDGSTWPQWGAIDSFELEKEGEGEPEGVGAVRIFRNGRVTGRDEILGFEQDRSFRYAHVKGLPVKDYRGEVDLRPAEGGGTTIHWKVSFSPRLPGTGWLLRKGLTRFIGQTVRGLARHSAAR